MKNRKIAIMVMMMTLAAVGSMGCGKNTGAVGQPVSVEKEKETTAEKKHEADESWIDAAWDEEESEEEDTEEETGYAGHGTTHGTTHGETHEAAHETAHVTEQEPAHSELETMGNANTGSDNFNTGLISDDWTDMAFWFDGVYYELPASYQELEENGWSFDLAEYGYTDGYILNPGDKTYDTIELTNPMYDEDITVWVGFINTSDTAKDILDCDIWSIQLDTCSGFTQVDNYPYMEIAQGIGIGSTREEVEDAFGPCDDIYEAEDYGYVTYNYSEDYTYYLKLTIDDNKGVTAISMSAYE